MKALQLIFEQYDVDFDRGFLPAQDPLDRLAEPFEAWETLADNFTAYINAGVIRERIDALSLIENPELPSRAAQERALLLLAFFAHAYVHLPPTPVDHIPNTIAIPLVKVAKALNRKPILSHASIVLNNWRRLDPQKPIQLDNLAPLCQFHGGLDESWFYLVTVEIEQVGARAIPLVLETMQCIEEDDFSSATQKMQQVIPILSSLTSTLQKMYQFCDPHTFYHRVRPFLASFEKIEYKGTALERQSHHGGSAAQSSLLQFFDAAFGVSYQNESTKKYLHLMRHHMPIQHTAFLVYVEEQSQIKAKASKNAAFKQVYKKAIELLVEFRNEHLKIVALYIMKQAKQAQATAKGTGGTSPMIFLKSVRNQNDQLLDHLSKEK